VNVIVDVMFVEPDAVIMSPLTLGVATARKQMHARKKSVNGRRTLKLLFL
jgi:hypothetical protein